MKICEIWEDLDNSNRLDNPNYYIFKYDHIVTPEEHAELLKKITAGTKETPRKGEWLRMSDLPEQENDRYKCSHCGNVIHHKNRMDLYTFNSWCGRCGSDNGRHITDALIKLFENEE